MHVRAATVVVCRDEHEYWVGQEKLYNEGTETGFRPAIRSKLLLRATACMWKRTVFLEQSAELVDLGGEVPATGVGVQMKTSGRCASRSGAGRIRM